MTTPRTNPPFGGVRRAFFDGAAFAVGAEASNTIRVTIQLTRAGEDLAGHGACMFYLSTNQFGNSLAADPGTFAISGDGLLIEFFSDRAGMMISENDGDIRVDINHSGAATYYLVLVMPDGSLAVSPAITFA